MWPRAFVPRHSQSSLKIYVDCILEMNRMQRLLRNRAAFRQLGIVIAVMAMACVCSEASRFMLETEKPESTTASDARRLMAQRRGGSSPRTWPGGSSRGSGQFRGGGSRQRRVPDRDEFPQWEIDQDFKRDVFTFVRIQYDSIGPFGWWDRWDNDYPDGDWNFSHRLQELTSIEVAPDSKVLRLSDPELLNYPFAYMAGVQMMALTRHEKAALRRYLLGGGFLMMDDFWTPDAWNNVLAQMRGVFPKRLPQELTLDHPIFHTVYDLEELPQVVDIRTWRDGYRFEHWHGYSGGDEDPHFWAYFDDDGRMMALLCHNNDLGDGWEREGENHEYFSQFSEKWSYPMGINIVIYAMTH